MRLRRVVSAEPGRSTFLSDELNMVIAGTTDRLHGQHGEGPRELERANLNLLGKYTKSSPREYSRAE
jgi:hypothetical protein